MADLKAKLGRVPCPVCQFPALLRENGAGTVSLTCDECDVSLFAKKGAAAQAKLRASLPPAASKKPATTTPATDEAKPTPAASPFGVLGLG
jgi:uncharacterized Zn finger protein (UPF0148 family)